LRRRLAVVLTSLLTLLVVPAVPSHAAGVEAEALGFSAGTSCDTGWVHIHNYNASTGHTHLKICIH
jgi:hypothetical protein